MSAASKSDVTLNPNIFGAKIQYTICTHKLDDPQWTNAVTVFNQDMAEAKKYLAEADKWYLPHKAEVELAKKQMAARIALFRDTETALKQWGKSHGALAQALQKDLAPDWTLLRQSADRIEKSIKKINKEDSKP